MILLFLRDWRTSLVVILNIPSLNGRDSFASGVIMSWAALPSLSAFS